MVGEGKLAFVLVGRADDPGGMSEFAICHAKHAEASSL
jgi:hypothetical protein